MGSIEPTRDQLKENKKRPFHISRLPSSKHLNIAEQVSLSFIILTTKLIYHSVRKLRVNRL
jgi:hypothetical protein